MGRTKLQLVNDSSEKLKLNLYDTANSVTKAYSVNKRKTFRLEKGYYQLTVYYERFSAEFFAPEQLMNISEEIPSPANDCCNARIFFINAPIEENVKITCREQISVASILEGKE